MYNHRLQPDTALSAKPMPAIITHALRTLFALSLLAMAPAHADTPQQRWVGDLPIMDGMTIEPELVRRWPPAEPHSQDGEMA